MAGQLYKGDVGSILRVTVVEDGAPFDAAEATSKLFKLKKPSGSVIERPADFETDGGDGVFTYTTAAGDLDESGGWSGQIHVALPGGAWHTDPWNFYVGHVL